ncbi:LysM peptidoglycan-binding domain-containing protein [Streptomyces pacificus]|uniref:N-acetylmuramoyl-L-alanine amidase n=1 Tax=Streptomyces pacificus TaxID=2705029 RepID=A0A6A0B2F7_9ACTN|nr:LysM peptidoglycan-binding domain-containing protein [Streptomyces pacificus]GFH38923.1 N-acetylmuramoyl-L-alanine amidase [Streptomyces pacificus]
MKLISRAEWGARPYRTPSGATPYSRARRGVKVHYLGTVYEDRPHTACAAYVLKIQTSHMDGNGWSDIGYSFVVCTHGSVFEGRGLKRRNSANGNTSLNEQDYAVLLLVGSSGLTQPTDAQLHGGRNAIDYCREHGPAGDWLGGHRDGYATACPGDALYAWVRKGAPRPDCPQAPTPTPGGPYTVEAGDTLSAIGRKLGVPWKDIAKANRLKAPYRIVPGQELTTPSKTGAVKPAAPPRPVVDLSKLTAAALADPPKRGTPVSYRGVKTVETALVREGLLAPSLADGHFGTATRTAYAAWQRRCGYRGTAADGIPGAASLKKLGSRCGFTVTN